MAGVQLISSLMGLTLAFKQRYGEEALEISRMFVENMGTRMGNKFKEMASVTGMDIQDIERVYHSWLDPILAPHRLDTRIEGNKLIVTRESPTMCAGLIVAEQLNLPLETVCHNISQPMFKGIARAVNPKAEYNMVQMGQQKCI